MLTFKGHRNDRPDVIESLSWCQISSWMRNVNTCLCCHWLLVLTFWAAALPVEKWSFHQSSHSPLLWTLPVLDPSPSSPWPEELSLLSGPPALPASITESSVICPHIESCVSACPSELPTKGKVSPAAPSTMMAKGHCVLERRLTWQRTKPQFNLISFLVTTHGKEMPYPWTQQ